MKQLLQNLGNGQTALMDVPAPGPRHGTLLIRTECSLISAGTERMLVDFGKAGWIGKARQQPEKVRAVLHKIRSSGLLETVRAVRAKLDQPIPLGYCQVGRVVDAGGAEWISPGDRAVSNGSHAEVVSVHHDLCAKVPAAVTSETAGFTPLCAIALQGINLLGVQRGDKVVVTGLGLIGQLAVRILRSSGCEVLGIDPAPDRRALAAKSGAHIIEGDPVAAALSWTGGEGVAGVLITASTSSNAVVNQSALSCRRRGKVVLVGVVGLQLNRADFYRNEVSFQVSCSYGARDASVSSSAQENFRRVLAWMAEGTLRVDDLITDRFDFGDAPTAYTRLFDRAALGILMNYRQGDDSVLRRDVELGPAIHPAPGVAIVGAGNFATRTLLPAMAKLDHRPPVRAVASHQGYAAMLAARAIGAHSATTDGDSVLRDPNVAAVFITTRHNSHAVQAIAALRAGKHVWVEKPLCLKAEELDVIAATLSAARTAEGRPVTLMVGFNRRFAPMAVALRDALAKQSGPFKVAITINAGRLERDHWTLNPAVGGGRIVGEGCHFVDLVRFLAGSPIGTVRCLRRDADGQDGGTFEVSCVSGTVAVIDYRTDLPPHIPKEKIEVTGAAFAATIHNWARLTSEGLGGVRMGAAWGGTPSKGHREALNAFLASVKGGPLPISPDEMIEVSRWSIAMQAMNVS